MAVPFSARCLLFFAAAIQDTRHSVISLVTGVLENPALALPPGNCGRPGFRPGCWILECDFVIDRVGIETREALDHMQAAGRTSEVRLVGEIRRIDDQCVAVPMAARVAEVLADALVQMRTPVQRDDSSFMNHFVENDHAIGTLHNLDIAVVRGTGNPRETLRYNAPTGCGRTTSPRPGRPRTRPWLVTADS